MKKLLIGIPAFDGVVAEAQQSIFSMVYRVARDMPDFDIAVHVAYKREQFRARNNIVDAAIANDFDYILMLDDDMIVPHNLIQRLVEHDKDVIGALYYQRGGAYNPVIMRRISKEEGDHSANFISHGDPIIADNPGLHEVDVVGGGCILFKTDVFRSILQPYFESERVYGTDLSICGRLQDAGHSIWVDTSLELGHVGGKQIITSRTIPAAQRTMARVNEDLIDDLQDYLGLHREALLSAMDRAHTKKARQDAWGDTDANDWESIRKYYEDHDEWHLTNLAYFNLWKDDPHKVWALTEGMALLKDDDRVLDYGAGLGHISIPLAEKYLVDAVDVMTSPTREFVKWRRDKHHLHGRLKLIGLNKELPDYQPVPNTYNGAYMISVMDHLTKPLEAVKWVADQIKPNGFFVCEYALGSDESEPQHLDRYDPTKFRQYMFELGFTVSPEYPWLFFKG